MCTRLMSLNDNNGTKFSAEGSFDNNLIYIIIYVPTSPKGQLHQIYMHYALTLNLMIPGPNLKDATNNIYIQPQVQKSAKCLHCEVTMTNNIITQWAPLSRAENIQLNDTSSYDILNSLHIQDLHPIIWTCFLKQLSPQHRNLLPQAISLPQPGHTTLQGWSPRQHANNTLSPSS